MTLKTLSPSLCSPRPAAATPAPGTGLVPASTPSPYGGTGPGLVPSLALSVALSLALPVAGLLGSGAVALGLLGLASPASAAIDLPRPSPAASVSQRVGLTDVSVEYFSPAVKDRKIWGDLVPWGELWRTGANASTKITFGKDVRVAGAPVKAGTYAVLTIPRKNKWTFILSSDTKLQGTRGYDQAKDVLRAEVSTRSASRRERMTFLFANTTDDRTELVLEWDKLALVIPIEADTAAQAKENIEAGAKASASDLASSARYFLDSGTEPALALELADNAARVDPSWVNTYVLARAQAANGRFAEATTTAKKAHELGLKADYYFWKDDVEKSIKEWGSKAD